MRRLALSALGTLLVAAGPEVSSLPSGLRLQVQALPDQPTFHLVLAIPQRHALPPGLVAAWGRHLGGARPVEVREEGGWILLAMKGHTDHLEETFALLAQGLLRPRLPQRMVLQAEQEGLPTGDPLREEARRRARVVLSGRTEAGAPEGDPVAVLGSALDPSRASLAVVGDVTPGLIRRLAWQHLGLWRSTEPLTGRAAALPVSAPSVPGGQIFGLRLPSAGTGRVLAALLAGAQESLPTAWRWTLGHEVTTGLFWLEARGSGDPRPALEAWLAQALTPAPGRLAQALNRVRVEADGGDGWALRLALGEADPPTPEALETALASLRTQQLQGRPIP